MTFPSPENPEQAPVWENYVVAQLAHASLGNIAYPMMRLEIAVAVARLGDPEYQRRAWVDQELPAGKRHLGVQEIAEWLAEDTIALEDPAELVGEMLHEDEVPLLRDLAEVFLPMFDEHGYTDDEVYLQDARWPTVVERAAAASALINANGGFPVPPSGVV